MLRVSHYYRCNPAPPISKVIHHGTISLTLSCIILNKKLYVYPQNARLNMFSHEKSAEDKCRIYSVHSAVLMKPVCMHSVKKRLTLHTRLTVGLPEETFCTVVGVSHCSCAHYAIVQIFCQWETFHYFTDVLLFLFVLCNRGHILHARS